MNHFELQYFRNNLVNGGTIGANVQSLYAIAVESVHGV
jgi:hypothetical protein